LSANRWATSIAWCGTSPSIRAARFRGKPAAAPEAIALAFADDRPSPEQSAADRDELRLVLEALAELPERTQLAVRMNRIEGRKLQEVADHLDLSVTRTFNIIVEGVAHCDRARARAAARRS
jgi:DNA-directed RNA polymerase specialized sigma24 family protein